jgi:hypothetical protein
MTREDIIRMALEVGLEQDGDNFFSPKSDPQVDVHITDLEALITAIKEALAQPEQDGKCKYCTDGCHACDARKLPEQEPVAWVGLDLDNMAEAFHRVIEEHHSRKNPFHDPVNGDAMIALRELRGLISYMKRNTTPPQRTWVGLTDDEIDDLSRTMVKGNKSVNWLCQAIEAKLKEKNT